MNNIKIFKTIKYTLGILSICTLMSIATFSTQTKAEVSGEKVTTSVEAVQGTNYKSNNYCRTNNYFRNYKATGNYKSIKY